MIVLRVLPLFALIGLGVLGGLFKLFKIPEDAIAVLNRYALFIGFPALIIASLADHNVALSGSFGFFAAQVVAFVAMLACLGLVTRASKATRDARGPLAMGAIFGNIAYLGIPFCISVLGAEAAGLGALSAAIHLTIGMCVGPFLLLRGGATEPGAIWKMWKRVLLLPLVWAPFLGLLLRATPDLVRSPIVALCSPVGASAAPIALFMLGLYLHTHRRQLSRPDLPLMMLTLSKLLLYPAIAWGVLTLVQPFLHLTGAEASVVLFMAAMPMAVTTFSIAEEFGRGQALLSRGVMLTTALSILSLPVWVILSSV